MVEQNNEQGVPAQTDSNKTQSASPGTDAGNKQQGDDVIARANAARDGLAEENKRMERNISELKKLASERILGGGSPAGAIEKKPEQILAEKDAEIARKAAENYFGKRR